MYMKIWNTDATLHAESTQLDGWCESRPNADIRLYLPRTFDRNAPENDSTSVSLSPGTVTVRRAFAGECQIYFALHRDQVHISDSATRIAAEIGAPLDVDACYEFVYFEYPSRSKTLYAGVRQLENDQRLTITTDGLVSIKVNLDDHFQLPSDELRADDEPYLEAELRKRIREAHATRAGERNTVLLSGGIDSQVMAIALHRDLELRDVHALTFHVKGARQSEVHEAEQAARQLGIQWAPVAVDPSREVDFDTFAAANSPYIGALAMDQLLSSPHSGILPGTRIFAGQDTRLHTPALGAKDQLLWRYVYASSPTAAAACMAGRIGSRLFSSARDTNFLRRLSGLFANSPEFAHFLANRYFHVRRFPFNEASADFSRVYRDIVEELKTCAPRMPRSAYNTIVQANWRRQYLFDIGHMAGSIRHHGYEPALPFYDKALAHFSARIPFALATRLTRGRAGHGSKPVRVNKYLLRNAYREELEPSLIFRDKAVCATNFMFLNGSLRGVLERFIADKRTHESEAGRRLHFAQIASLCKQRQQNWTEEDNWVGNVAFNALVVWHLISMHGISSAPTVAPPGRMLIPR